MFKLWACLGEGLGLGLGLGRDEMDCELCFAIFELSFVVWRYSMSIDQAVKADVIYLKLLFNVNYCVFDKHRS